MSDTTTLIDPEKAAIAFARAALDGANKHELAAGAAIALLAWEMAVTCPQWVAEVVRARNMSADTIREYQGFAAQVVL